MHFSDGKFGFYLSLDFGSYEDTHVLAAPDISVG